MTTTTPALRGICSMATRGLMDDLVCSGVGVVVAVDARPPDVSTDDALHDTVLDTTNIGDATGPCSGSAHPAAMRRLLDFMRSSDSVEVKRRHGMEPA